MKRQNIFLPSILEIFVNKRNECTEQWNRQSRQDRFRSEEFRAKGSETLQNSSASVHGKLWFPGFCFGSLSGCDRDIPSKVVSRFAFGTILDGRKSRVSTGVSKKEWRSELPRNYRIKWTFPHSFLPIPSTCWENCERNGAPYPVKRRNEGSNFGFFAHISVYSIHSLIICLIFLGNQFFDPARRKSVFRSKQILSNSLRPQSFVAIQLWQRSNKPFDFGYRSAVKHLK
jgi:hypothetical protein